MKENQKMGKLLGNFKITAAFWVSAKVSEARGDGRRVVDRYSKGTDGE